MEATGGDELWGARDHDESGNVGSRDSGEGVAGGGVNSGGGVGGGGGHIKEERIQVSVRLRPPNAKELARNDQTEWECINDTTIIFRNSLHLPERSVLPTAYTFDRVFRCDSTTKQVYEEGAKEVALSVVSGINASIFAYGQTSSGKTYTMTGITELAVTDIYDYVQRHNEREFVLKFSAMEIYNEAVRDLLSADSTPLRLLDDPERGTIVEKLSEETLRDWDHLKELLSICEAQRQIGETSLNETSSRSHQILRLSVESSAREFLGKGNSSSLAATVDFVDLAGSERASQTMSAGTRLKEGCHINRSLLTLGTVVRKLSKGRNGHIPYRDSKLTRILQPSLGGNARTAIICTMSPAQSHVEQSRNTLLFASCAKEVSTSARVNVVMSDKALVKHLQKELERLETELRNTRVASSKPYADALLKEKDVQIKKMEKEIKELIQQRDLAQLRLANLIKDEGYDQESQQSDGFVQPPTSHDLSNCEDEQSLYDSSSVLDFGFINSNLSQCSSRDSANCNDSYLENLNNSNERDATPTQNSMSSASSVFSSSYKGEERITQGDCLNMEDLCKEVRCIEIHETIPSRSEEPHDILTEGSNNLLPSNRYDNQFGHQEPITKLNGYKSVDVGQAIGTSVKASPNDSSLWPSVHALTSSRSLGLRKSRSCRASLMNGSAYPSSLEEQTENISPSTFLKDFTGRPEVFQRRLSPANYKADNEVLSEDGSQTSETTSIDLPIKPDHIKTDTEENISSISTFVAELKEMAQTQFQKQLNNGQVVDQEDNDGTEVRKSMKDTGLDTIVNSTESSHWPAEFERQQREIIELWHACHVSLVHRTYFFLLFKGDPSDSIYMEVELRRLTFLKRVFTQGDLDKSMVENARIVTPASSMRALRREREMLCRQMQKRLSAEERESLYRKWGVPLNSKQRRMKVTRLLWSDTKNMDHIRESASVVATLVGLLEPDQAIKEMFGLSFTPQKISHKSQSWKHGMSSLV